MKLLTYRGHIRDNINLCKILGIDITLDRKTREEAIILKSYENYGVDMVNHIEGMFAFAIEDGNKTICVRDPFGTKPFYYHITSDNKLLYGTFIKDILEASEFNKELNEDMLQHYLTLSYAGGEDTFFKGIKKLLPGHILTFEDGKCNISCYFKPYFNPDSSKSIDEYADELHSVVTNIMTEIKDDDETVESFLSGGVDSSYVFAMSDAMAANSIGYDDERFDESHLAAETAKLLNKDINIKKVTPEEYFAEVKHLCEYMELPLADASAVVFSLGCKETAKHSKVCYSGEGSDEFFGGYNMYRNAKRYGENLKTFYVGNTMLMKEDEKARLLKNYNPNIKPIDIVGNLYDDISKNDYLNQMSEVDIRIWLEGDIYLNVDKMSEAAGLEVRMPLTDRRIFDIASRLPVDYKVSDEVNKVVFRRAAAKIIPEEIAYRKKLGFIVPIRIWMADDRYNSDIKRALHSESALKFFNEEVLEEIWNSYVGGDSDLWRKIWTIYIFIVWYEIYFE